MSTLLLLSIFALIKIISTPEDNDNLSRLLVGTCNEQLLALHSLLVGNTLNFVWEIHNTAFSFVYTFFQI